MGEDLIGEVVVEHAGHQRAGERGQERAADALQRGIGGGQEASGAKPPGRRERHQICQETEDARLLRDEQIDARDTRRDVDVG